MTLTVEKRGDAQVIQLPKGFLSSLGFHGSGSVDVKLEDEAIVLRKTADKRVSRTGKTIEQRFEEFYGVDFETAIRENPYDFEEVDWGPPVGNEVW